MSESLSLLGAHVQAAMQNCWPALLPKVPGYIMKWKSFPWLITDSIHVEGATADFYNEYHACIREGDMALINDFPYGFLCGILCAGTGIVSRRYMREEDKYA